MLSYRPRSWTRRVACPDQPSDNEALSEPLSRVSLTSDNPVAGRIGNMKRRDFIALLGSAAAWPLPTHSQHRIHRIGALVIGNADVPGFQKELRAGLRELGRVEGRDYAIELRSAEGQLGRLPELAAELVRLKVDTIVALYTPCALAAKQATREIPIVLISGDPLGTGLVESLSRPGANVTGLSTMGRLGESL
jgi:putative tryptophan/tyrosine transport system substrate-binding protein